MTFWFVALGLSALVALSILWVMLRRPEGVPEDPELAIYRDQLTEVDRDLARGVLAEDEAERLRTEVARRMIEADRSAGRRHAGGAPRGATLAAVIVSALVLVGGTGAIYLGIGRPDLSDQPMAQRLAAAEERRQTRIGQDAAEARAATNMPDVPQADPAFLQLMTQLRETVAERPDDERGLRLLAENEARLGNFVAAADAQAQLVEVLAEPGAQEFGDLAGYLITAAGGYVSPEAEAAIMAALQADRSDGRARYFAGLLQLQIGRPDIAFRYWRQLLEEGPATAPWMPPIRSEIQTLARLAGVDYTPPPARAPAAGPSTADIDAAADMAPEDREQMVRGMVESLSQRLGTEGGTPEDWARLVRAYGVLGETERAAAIWAEARQVFAGTGAGLDAIRDAARDAGVAVE